jgi:hypothetical protein
MMAVRILNLLFLQDWKDTFDGLDDSAPGPPGVDSSFVTSARKNPFQIIFRFRLQVWREVFA